MRTSALALRRALRLSWPLQPRQPRDKPMHSPFFSTHSDRVTRARQKYFEDGQPPSGVVNEAIFQSWTRCLRAHQNPRNAMEFLQVSQSRVQLAMQRSHFLLESWNREAPLIEAALGATNCAAMLMDSSGVIIGSACVGRCHEKIIPLSTRLGVNLSEEAVGTTAPGIVARTGRKISVLGPEHFFDTSNTMHCAAAPIRDIHGKLAGILDISSEEKAFTFDAASVVGVFAASVENRLLIAQSRELVVVRMQISPSLLDTPMSGLIGVDFAGNVVWRNAVASRFLGLADTITEDTHDDVESLLGCGLRELVSLSGPVARRLPTGLLMYVQVEITARDGYGKLFGSALGEVRAVSEDNTAPDPERVAGGGDRPPADAASLSEDRPFSLREADTDLIRKALKETGGNIAAAARMLGVSRGLVYRRLRAEEKAPRPD